VSQSEPRYENQMVRNLLGTQPSAQYYSASDVS
jgi:hypothetical protein